MSLDNLMDGALQQAQKVEVAELEAVTKTVKQVQNESELSSKSTSKDEKKTDNKRDSKKKSDGINSLKTRVDTLKSALTKEREDAEKRRLNTPKILLRKDAIDLEYSTQIAKDTYKDTLRVVDGKVARALLPAIEALIRVFQAALQAQNLRTLKTAHKRNNDGKLTSDPLTYNGRATYVANAVDDLRYIWEVIAKNDACMRALEQFQKAYDNLQLSKIPAVTDVQTHRETYVSGSELSKNLNEYKEYNTRRFFNVSGPLQSSREEDNFESSKIGPSAP